MARWILALAALAFLLMPGHRNLPLSGIPISDLWFFIALLVWAFVFIALPWKPLRLRRAWPWVAALLLLCGLKLGVGAVDDGHGLLGMYTAVVPPIEGKEAYFPPPGEDGRSRVSFARFDRQLNLLDNSFRPFGQSFNLTFFNARPLHYLPPADAAAAALEVCWSGAVYVPGPGEYVFAADVEAGDRYTIHLSVADGPRHTWRGDAAKRPENFEPLAEGMHSVEILFEHPARQPAIDPAGDRAEKREQRIRFRLLRALSGEKFRPVPGIELQSECSCHRFTGRFWMQSGWAVLALSGVLWVVIAARHAAWGRFFARRQRVRGALFAFVLVQIGASTFMTIRHTTARPQWNILNSYDDKIYERRAQTFLAHGWTGPAARREGLLHRSPMMEYYLPALHVMFGGDYGLIATAQNVLTGLIVLAAFGIGRAVFRSPTAGLWAAAAVAIDPAFTEFGRKLLPAAPAIVLLTTAVWLMFRTRKAGRWWRAVLAGATFGLAIIARVNLAGALPGALVLLLWRGRRPLPRRLAHAGLLLAATFAVWLIVPIRQMQLTDHWFWTPSQGPTILLVGNRPNGGRDSEALTAYQNDFLAFADRAAPDEHTRELLRTFGERALGTHDAARAHWHWDPLGPKDLFHINPYLTRFLIEEITRRPGRLLRTWAQKAAVFWWVDSEGWHGSHFRPYTVMLLVTVGIGLFARQRGRSAALLLMIAGIFFILVASYFEERHRSVIIPLIDVLFAGSIVWFVRRMRRRMRRRAAGRSKE